MGDDVAGPVRGQAWERLEDQLSWYDRKSKSNQWAFTRLKVFQLFAGAGVPVAAGVHAAVWVTGGLGAAVVVAEGIQQLGQFQQNWISYRSTCEGLKHEKYLYLAQAGPYSHTSMPERLLAQRAEALVSREHEQWTAEREQSMHDTDLSTSSEAPLK